MELLFSNNNKVMASKVSTPPKTVTKPPVPKPRPKPPVQAAEKATPVRKPVDKVSVRDEKLESSSTDLGALTNGLVDNYSVSGNPGVTKTPQSSDRGPVSPGQASVDLARRFEGQLSQNVKGKLEHFGAAGGRTNNCADFVSSVLQASDRGIERTPLVNELRQQLQDKGWSEISPEDAKPGDVWMTRSNTHGNRHTELVTQADGQGGFRTIGSNNISDNQQRIFERDKTGGVIYGYREPQAPVPTPRPN